MSEFANSKQVIGKAVLAVSAMVAAPAGKTPGQDVERLNDLPRNLVPTTDLDPSLPSVHFRSGRSSISDLEPALSTEQQREETLAGLLNSHEAAEILSSISTEQLADPPVAEEVVRSISKWIRHPERFPTIVKSSYVRSALFQILLTEPTGRYGYARLFSAIPNELRSAELTEAMRASAIARIKELAHNKGAIFGTDVLEEYIPAELLTLQDYKTHIQPELANATLDVVHRAIRTCHLPSDETRQLLTTIFSSTEQALCAVFPGEFSSKNLANVNEFFLSNPDKCAREIGRYPFLLSDDTIRGAAVALYSSDLSLLPDVLESPDYKNIHSEVVQRHLSMPGNIGRICEKISCDFSILAKYPAAICEVPEICHAVRCKLNEVISFERSVQNDAGESVVRAIISKFSQRIPDIAALIRTQKDFEDCQHLLPRILSLNPRANSYISPIASEIDLPYAEALSTSINAMQTLEIEGIQRFDNAREIIVNRYHASAPQVKDKLDRLLGSKIDYSREEGGFESDPALDLRPLCVVVMGRPIADHNGAFNAKEKNSQDDLIDGLTSFYKVVYYEAGSPELVVDKIVEAAKAYNKKVPLVILGGHGCELGIALDSDAQFRPDAILTGRDARQFSRAEEYLAEDCKIVLISCSAAKSFDGRPSIAAALYKALPLSTIYGPDNEATARITFKRSGEFASISFVGANRVAFRANHPNGVIEEGSQSIKVWLEAVVKTAQKHPLTVPFAFGILGLTVMKSIEGFKAGARGIKGLLKRREERRRQPRLFD